MPVRGCDKLRPGAVRVPLFVICRVRDTRPRGYRRALAAKSDRAIPDKAHFRTVRNCAQVRRGLGDNVMSASKQARAWVAIAIAYAFVLQSIFGVLADDWAVGATTGDALVICSSIASTSHGTTSDQPVKSSQACQLCCVLCAAVTAAIPPSLAIPASLPVPMRAGVPRVRAPIVAAKLPKLSQGPPRSA